MNYLQSSPPLLKRALVAAAMLTSAMVFAMVMKIYDFDRSLMLALQYAFWAITAYLILTTTKNFKSPLQKTSSPISQAMVALLLAMSISTAATLLTGRRSDVSDLAPQTAALIFLAVPYFAMTQFTKTFGINRAMTVTCHFILALGLYSIGSDLIGNTSYETYGERYFGPLGDQVAWALTLPLVIYFATRRLLLTGLAAIGLALTASRGPALVTAAALILLMIFNRGRRLEYAGMVSLMVIVAVYEAEMLGTLIGRFSDTNFLSNDRTGTASVGLKLFSEAPVFGNGYNSLAYFYPSTQRLISMGILPAQTSTVVQMLSDGGMITFLAYLSLVIVTTIWGLRLLRQAPRIADGAVTSGVVAWVLAMYWINQSALWFIVGSYIGPLVFGMTGLIAGTWLRLCSSGSPVNIELHVSKRRSTPA